MTFFIFLFAITFSKHSPFRIKLSWCFETASYVLIHVGFQLDFSTISDELRLSGFSFLESRRSHGDNHRPQIFIFRPQIKAARSYFARFLRRLNFLKRHERSVTKAGPRRNVVKTGASRAGPLGQCFRRARKKSGKFTRLFSQSHVNNLTSRDLSIWMRIGKTSTCLTKKWKMLGVKKKTTMRRSCNESSIPSYY